MPLQKFLKFIGSSVVLFGAIGLVIVSSETSVHAQTLNEQIKALTTELGKSQTIDNDTLTLIAALQIELGRLRCNSIDCKIETLKAFAGDTSVSAEKLNQTQVSQILDALQKLAALGKPGGDNAAAALALSVKAALDGINPQKPGFADDKADFETAIKILQKWQSATVSATNRAIELTDVLLKQASALRSNDESFKKAIADLKDALQKSSILQGPLLNIVEAWYGDLYLIPKAAAGRLRVSWKTGKGWRVCNVTSEVRASCQAKATCPFKPASGQAGTGLEIDGVKLCGDDPTPYAPQSETGLLIAYECLDRSKSDWDKLQQVDRPTVETTRDTVKWATLRRGTTTSIRCTAEIASP